MMWVLWLLGNRMPRVGDLEEEEGKEDQVEGEKEKWQGMEEMGVIKEGGMGMGPTWPVSVLEASSGVSKQCSPLDELYSDDLTEPDLNTPLLLHPGQVELHPVMNPAVTAEWELRYPKTESNALRNV